MFMEKLDGFGLRFGAIAKLGGVMGVLGCGATWASAFLGRLSMFTGVVQLALNQ